MGTVIATRATGVAPGPIALDSTDGLAYVVSLGSPNVTVINGTSEIGSVRVGVGPGPAAFDPDNGLVYVPCSGSGIVSIVKGASLQENISVGGQPYYAVFNTHDRQVYVPNSNRNVVSVLNGSRVTATVSVTTAPVYAALNPLSGLVYVLGSTPRISIMNGTMVVANVTAGASPIAVAFDPVNSAMYVVNFGSDNVTVFNGSASMGSVAVGVGPVAIAVDPVSGYVYVVNSNSNTVSIINGTSLLATRSFSVQLWGLAYDPANGYVYVSNAGGSSVSVLNGTSLFRSQIATGNGPGAGAFDPVTGLGYFPNSGDNTVSIVSTLLAEGPIVPIAPDSGVFDVNQSVVLDVFLYGIGSGSSNVTATVTPDSGLGCATSVTVARENRGAALSLPCRPTLAGSYAVWINVTDTAGVTVWTSLRARVCADPQVSLPVASENGITGGTSVDTLEPVVFSSVVTGGTGKYSSILWRGLPPGACAPRNLTASCTFSGIQSMSVSFSVTDSNGQSATGPTLHFAVVPRPQAVTPVANRTGVDAGQSIGFAENATGGPGTYRSYEWTGLSTGVCAGLSGAGPSCSFSQPGTLDIGVSATDSNGVSSRPSPALFVVVSPRLTLTGLVENRSSADVGQAVSWSVGASGGPGAYAYFWTNLPAGCVGENVPTLSCVVGTPGATAVSVKVTDPNGAMVRASGEATLTVYPDPEVSVLALSSSNLVEGQRVILDATVTGGSGNYTFGWSGLPSGCTTAGGLVTCYPSQQGTFRISAEVVDSNGMRAASSPVTLTVGEPPSGANGGGIPSTFLYGGIGAAVLLVAFATLLMLRRRKH